MKRLVLMASGRGSNVAALLRAIDAGTLRAEVVGLVSDQAGAGALEIASARGIATSVVPFKKGDDRDAWNRVLADAVAALSPDAVVLAGFMRILGADFVDRFSGRILNVHPALLPAFPGHDGPAQALRTGVKVTGCTVHLVDHGVDTGAILAQGVVPVFPGDDVLTLHARIQRIEHRLFPATIDAFLHGELENAPRDEAASLTSPSFG